MVAFNEISSFFKYLNLIPPNNPLFAIVDLKVEAKKWRENSEPITTDFYAFALKRVAVGSFQYGRTPFDFQEGLLVFTQPGQVLQWAEAELVESGYFVVMHRLFLENTFLEHKVKNYSFFSYAVTEALHVSKKEEENLLALCQKLEEEYQQVYDLYNKDILVSYVNTILSYAQRFYNRQFEHRKPVNTDLTEKFYQVLHFLREKDTKAIPTVQDLATAMHMSPKYLSDLLKNTTGKTAMDHIHLSLLEEAKSILLNSKSTVSEIAYNLGFEYPQYFTRLFKNKVGMSPVNFRKQMLSEN